MNTPSDSEASGAGWHGPGAGAKVRRLLPLTVWLCSDTATTTKSNGSGNQDEKRSCARHREMVGEQLARHLINACTQDGDLVAEAFTCGEATLVAAGELGRRAVACVPHFPLAQHIGVRLRAALPEDRLTGLAMRPCRPDQMARGFADHLEKVDLVIAAPPSYEVGGRPEKGVASWDCPACRADMWMLTEQQLGAFLAASWRVLRPGGHLAVITTARHQGGRLVDPAPLIIRQARVLGFRYAQHVIALRVPIDGDELVVQADPSELGQLRDIRSRALPPTVSVHADVCLFRKAPSGAGGAR
ncbi:MAG: hypothetical protein JWL97_4133 [Gemmatimonadales bacterium]|jgi:hypothetical protein|nr:hypothetical protein [Gemmatimonadales bacterium]